MFSLFEKKQSIVESGLLQGAVDNRCHILYGLDDGVKTVEESLSILQWLEEHGVKKVWFTPHVMEDVPNTTEGILARFNELKSVYKGGLEFDVAAEYMMDNIYEERLAAKDLLTHGDDTVLVETSTWAPPIDLWGTLDSTMAAGYRPLIAHPERYRYMDYKDYLRLHKMGCLLQLNLPSIVGFYGETAMRKAEYLLEKGWYCLSGSDCHRFKAIKSQYDQIVLKKNVVKALEKIMGEYEQA